MALQEKEDTSLPAMRQQLTECEKAIDNMLNAIQMGVLTASTKERLEKLEMQREELKLSILQAQMARPRYTKEQVVSWISRFKYGNVDDPQYQKQIIDTFINSIYVFDDKLVFTYNFKDGTETITLAEIQAAFGSDLTQVSPPEDSRRVHEQIMNPSFFPLEASELLQKLPDILCRCLHHLFSQLSGGVCRVQRAKPAVRRIFLGCSRQPHHTASEGYGLNRSGLCVLARALCIQRTAQLQMNRIRLNRHHCGSFDCVPVSSAEPLVQLSNQSPPIDAGTDSTVAIDLQRGLVDGRIVAAMPIQNEEMPNSMLHQRGCDAVQHQIQPFIADVNASGKILMIRANSIRDCRRHHNIFLVGNLLCQIGWDDKIRSQSALWAVLLGTADRNHHDWVLL